MKRYKILFASLYAVLSLLFLLGTAGCTRDEAGVVEPGKPKQQVTIGVAVPGFEKPVTRSIGEDKGEAVIATLDILVFDNSTPSPKLTEHVKVDGATIVQSTSGPTYNATFKASLTANPDAAIVVLIANASSQVNTAISEAPIGSAKQVVMEKLQFATEAGSQPENAYKWNVSADYTPIPMYGERSVNGITTGMNIPLISLTHMLARIDIQNNAGNFELEKIFLVNYNTRGYIAPPWNTQNGSILHGEDADYPYNKNKDPELPSDPGKQPGTEEASINYTYTQIAGAVMSGEIYTYEAGKATGDEAEDAANAVCLIVKGIYKGDTNYYRIDFTKNVAGTAPGLVQYMPLYRNHKYIVNIKSAEGRGYKSFDEALHSTTVLSNLKTTLHIIDMNGINDIVYDGQYYIGTKSRQVDIPWNANKTITYGISSDYEGNWSADIINPGSNSWLRFEDNRTTISGDDINESIFKFKVTSIGASPSTDVSAVIRITAGRLTYDLTVNRVPMSRMFARSNVVANQRERTLTFAVTEDDNDKIPASSQGVLFKWGSLIAIEPAGNGNNLESYIIHNPSGYSANWGKGISEWDKIPYGIGYFTLPPVASGEDVDAFATYNEGKGFLPVLGLGDICRYISSGDGKGKWVEGDWRMPTFAEIRTLYDETGIKTVTIGGFANTTAALNLSGVKDGMYKPGSGYWLGKGVNSGTTNADKPPRNTVFLPAGGHRYPNGNGDIVQVGAFGYYWTASPHYDQITVNYPWLSKYGVGFYDADRSYAFPVRCIRDY